MDQTVILVLASIAPIFAWIPVAGREQAGNDRRNAGSRSFAIMAIGALAAIPAGILRLTEPAAPSIMSYFTAHTLFRSLVIDGLGGTLLPLVVLLLTFILFGNPGNPRSIAGRASLIILSYCFLDGFYAGGLSPDLWNIPDAVSRSLSKLLMAPLWGILFSYVTPGIRRMLSVAALTVIGSAFNGLTGFLIDLDYSLLATIPAGIALVLMFLIRPESYVDRYMRVSAGTDVAKTEAAEPAGDDSGRERRKPSHGVYQLMKQRRYDDARITAERFLEHNGDLYLFAWHALLRWIAGEKACKLIFLQRYEALGEGGRERLRNNLEEYLGYYSTDVDRWISDLENSYYPRQDPGLNRTETSRSAISP